METEVNGYMGWQEFADLVSELYEQTSRQTVYGWWRRRHANGFPELHTVNGRRKIPVRKALEWRRTYVRDQGGRPRKEVKT